MKTKTALWLGAASATAALLCIIEAIASQRTVATTLTPASFPPLVASGFVPGGVYPATNARAVPANLRLYGSYVGSDRNTGEARTAWYEPVPNVSLMVAGYPTHPGIALTIEVDTPARIVRIPAIAFNPGERWTEVSVFVRDIAHAKRFRVHAVDRSTTYQGWVGFSEPFVVGEAGASRTFGAVGTVAIYPAAFFALVTAALCTFLAMRATPSGRRGAPHAGTKAGADG